ncbi:MAG: hypothetical protein LBJ63_08000 [Prevotellaceae bacterium]|jgi:hypothetical protein|nr:hypothetical protein [Prevotellaceae bacterium]
MTKAYKYIEELLEKFFNGDTTFEEERELYYFFQQSKIPEHLKRYRSIFNYFEDNISDKLDIDLSYSEKWQKKPLNIKRIIYFSGVAAAILLIVYVLVPFRSDYNPYTESYIVVNGIKSYNIHDAESIENEILAEINRREAELDNLEIEIDKYFDIRTEHD